MWTIITAGITLGLLSSFHCVGMCGAMAFALPVQHLSHFKKNIAIALYHFGRMVTYTFLGLVFGWAGRHLYLAGMQQWISVAAGIFMLFTAVQYFNTSGKTTWAPLKKFHSYIGSVIGKLMKQQRMYHMLLLGMANGLLPCGMVYIAIAAALTLSTIPLSMLFMFSFGAGTLPAMMALSYFGMMANLQIRNQAKKLVPFFVVAIGILLILRGMNLGIPYISPEMQANTGNSIICH